MIAVAIVNVNKILFLVCFCLFGCQTRNIEIKPEIVFIPSSRNIDCLSSAFSPLSEEEEREDFGKELKIALVFAKEFDLYRAVTSYKRALILIPKRNCARVQQIEYSIMECYYLAMKYQEVIDTFETSHLLEVKPDFKAFGQLLVILYDSYHQLGLSEKATRILNLIEKANAEIARKLKTYVALSEADFACFENLNLKETFLIPYIHETKSIQKARRLNMLLPGAGYYYVGQKKAALTSLIINSLFGAAAYQFFARGYPAAGLITLSFEAGWYFGGINGAGLAAKEYNERLYEEKAKDFMLRERLFPLLTFETSF